MKMDIIYALIILCSLLNLNTAFIPNWKLEGEIFSLFSGDSTIFEKPSINYNGYYMVTKIIKDNGEIKKENWLKNDNISLNKKVNFEEIGNVFTGVPNLGTVICPIGTFHPHDGNGNEISITNFANDPNRNKKWNLECFYHSHSGLFLAFYYNKGSKALYGYYKEDGGNKIWNSENEFYGGLYFARLQNYEVGDEEKTYPILYIAQDGDRVKLMGMKETLKINDIHRSGGQVKNLFKDKQSKSRTIVYVDDVDNNFYYLTYDSNGYFIGFSTTPPGSNYFNYDDFNTVRLTETNDLSFNFKDNIEILEMNFIKKTPYVYYKINNTETGKIYYGIMEFKTQQILFNTDDSNIREFVPYSDYEMLIITSDSAYKYCLYKYNDECQPSCPTGTELVISPKGNECKGSQPTVGTTDCKVKIMPEGICEDECDLSVYALNGNECALCSYFYTNKPYKFYGSNVCLENPPENYENYTAKYNIIKCKKGYKLDEDTQKCITNCFSLCTTCNDFSNDNEHQDCIGCINGYDLNSYNNCILHVEPPEPQPPSTELSQQSTNELVTEKITEQVSEYKSEHITVRSSEIKIEPTEKKEISDSIQPEVIPQPQVDSCSLEKCKTCNAESLQVNLCLTCNEEQGYMKVNYTILHPDFYDCVKRNDPLLNNFYYSETKNEFRPCYKTCKKCSEEGNPEAHHCLECESEFMFRPGHNPGKNCVVKSEYYYLDSYNQYKSLDKFQCPLEAKYMVKEKKYCIYDCKQDDDYKYLYSGNCVASCPENTIPDTNFICKEDPTKVYFSKIEIDLGSGENSLKVVKNLAKVYTSEFRYTQNHVSFYQDGGTGVILYKNQLALEELPLEMPKVNMKNCSNKVKDDYNIEGNLLTSVVQTKEKGKHETAYSLYHPDSGEKLEAILLCQNETIEVKENITAILNTSENVNFKLQISLVEQGINIFDLNDPFYKDICYDFDNPGKRDIALRDRVKQAYPNAILCEEGCRNKGINLGDMTASCDCTFRDITQNNFVKDNEILDSMMGEVFNILDDSNIMVVKCYKYIIKYFTRSYGGIATTIIIAINIILIIVLFSCEFKKIGQYAIMVTKNYLKLLKIFSVKNEMTEVNPPKKNINNKDKKEDNHKRKSFRRKSKKLSTRLPDKDKEQSGNKLKVSFNNAKVKITTYRETDDILNEEKKLKNFYDEYLATSPDEMEFDDAIKKDDRNFCKYFADNLKEKQIITNTFIASDHIKKRSIKIILFNLNLVLYIVVNGLFFSEVYISELFNIKEEDEKFFSFLPRSIDRLFYATVVSVIVGYLVDCFFIEEQKIKNIFKRERLNPDMIKQSVLDLIREIKRRYVGFIILVLILLLCSLYYLLCFNYVYPKSQIEWIKSSIAIIIVINILSILRLFLGAVLRYLSFGCENEYIFKFSRAFS